MTNHGAPELFMRGAWGLASTRVTPSPMVPEPTFAREFNIANKRYTLLVNADLVMKRRRDEGLSLDGQPYTTDRNPDGTCTLQLPAGRHVMDMQRPDATIVQRLQGTVAHALARAQQLKQTATRNKPPTAPSLRTLWQMNVRCPMLAFRVADLNGDGRREILCGLADGKARLLDSSGNARWEFKTGGPVAAVHSADLDGDGKQEVLVGSDDAFLYALDRDGRLLWKHSPPFGHQPWIYWTLHRSMVKKIASGDINGDGKPEILLGCGNMRCVVVSAQGKQLWEFRTDHGTCTTLAVADVNGDGRGEVIGGKGIFASNSNGFQLDGQGKLIAAYRNQGWTSIVCDLLVSDLEGDGRMEAIFGTDRGENLRVFDARSGSLRWAKALGDNCEAIAAADLDGDGVKDVIAGSASLYVSAFSAKGKRFWFAAMPDSVASLATGDVNRDGRPEVVVGCTNGTLSVLGHDGKLLRRVKLAAPITQVAIARLTNDAAPAVLAATQGGLLAALAW